MPSCTVCNVQDARDCLRCRSTAYCSLECQQADWSVHKLLCAAFAALPPRPASSFRKAILFPAKNLASKPRLVWVDTVPKQHPAVGSLEAAVLQGHLNIHPAEPNVVGIALHMIRGNALRERPENDHVIELTCRDVYEDLPTNESIAKVNGSRWTNWYGPYIAMSKIGTNFDPTHYQDVTLNDFRDVADYLSWYRDGHGSVADGIGSNTLFAQRVLQQQTGKVAGVRVNCVGDISRCNRPQFELVEVPRSHPLFYEEGDDPSPLLEFLDGSTAPFCAKPYAPDARWKADEAFTDRFDNPAYRALFVDLSPESQTWGDLPPWRQNVKGSVLLASRLRVDLSVEYIQRLVHFAAHHLAPQVLSAMRTQEERQNLLDSIPGKFEQDSAGLT